MALVVKEYVPKLKFQYQNFEIMDIPGLIINIWSYSHDHGQYCNICCTYKNWCIKALKKKWLKQYILSSENFVKEMKNGATYREFRLPIACTSERL